MNAEGILAQLKGVRPSGSGWVARCPAHDDQNPSLSIHERDGKVLLKCFAGCTIEAVCGSAGIELSELFGENGAAPQIVAKYDYVDENGNPADGYYLFHGNVMVWSMGPNGPFNHSPSSFTYSPTTASPNNMGWARDPSNKNHILSWAQ